MIVLQRRFMICNMQTHVNFARDIFIQSATMFIGCIRSVLGWVVLSLVFHLLA
jgi:hypothetical protein